MKIIIGLGNPGKKFETTRHNTGFFTLDRIQFACKFPEFEFNKKFNAEISSGEMNGEKIILAKPQTFMNLSGEAVRAILDFYKLTADDILVIHDDIDILFGKYKVATDSSSAGHNGIKNIIEKLGTQKFRRIRVGIGQEKDGALVCRLGVHDFVLENFSEEELKALKKIAEEVLKEINKL